MVFAIIGEDRPNSQADHTAGRLAHVEPLNRLQEKGLLLMADRYVATSVYANVNAKALPA